RFGAELIIAVEQPGRGWLVMSSPWPRSDWPLLWQLIAQTLILYAVVLLPVLWGARRISQPLQSLTNATRRFKPGEAQSPLAEQGPQDVRSVIAAFNALRLRVTAMLDEKDRMLGAIGHDLRTPLAALRVRIESVEDDDDRARMADTIDEMNRTLDDILSLARLGRPSEARTEVDLTALVDAVVEDFIAIGSPVSFVEADRVTLSLRPSLMRRAIRNLIENAVKYGVSAEVRVVPGKDQVAITVADQGPGIPAEKLEDVFDAFTRLETSRNRDTGGAGLGLALARAIVREAGGEVTLTNRPGGGLDATITLPRQRG
uniref:sensor histidine kinase n=2 Tax=unclassified Sphingomonas TaxID=196159 RepID=UPI0035A97E63